MKECVCLPGVHSVLREPGTLHLLCRPRGANTGSCMGFMRGASRRSYFRHDGLEPLQSDPLVLLAVAPARAPRREHVCKVAASGGGTRRYEKLIPLPALASSDRIGSAGVGGSGESFPRCPVVPGSCGMSSSRCDRDREHTRQQGTACGSGWPRPQGVGRTFPFCPPAPMPRSPGSGRNATCCRQLLLVRERKQNASEGDSTRRS